MKLKFARTLAVFVSFFAAGFALAQDLGPQIRKLDDGVYVYVGKNFNSNCGIVLTREGVVLIDSGHNPTDSRAILEAVKKLTPLPVRFLIDTEPHPDHTTGHFVFSPPATIIAAAMPAIVLTVGFTTSLLRTGDRPRNALQKALSAPAPRWRIGAWRAGSGCGTCSRWADRRPMAPLR